MFRRAVWAALVVSVGSLAVGSASAVTSPSIDRPATAFAAADRGASTQVIAPPAPPADATARYRVTLNVDWTSSTHPGSLPGNAHVSPPVLAVHAAPGVMFATGTLASPGIEAMAERGVTGTLVNELRSGSSGLVTDVRTGAGIPFPAVGTRSFDVTLSQVAHRVSLVTMLAPSPDWFVGIDTGVFVDGQWVDSVSLPLANYDAGTDSGAGFASGNADTRPQQPISGPRDAAFAAAAAEAPFGSVTITRIG